MDVKAAQRLGFTLEEVGDLLEAGRHHHRRVDAGLTARAEQKLAEVETKIADLEVIAGTLRAAIAAGCEGPGCVRGQLLLPDLVRHDRRGSPTMTSVSDRTRRRLPTALAGLGAVACVACCALPLLLAAGALSGAGWAITGQWLPAVVGLLGASAAVMWWFFRRRHQQGCAGGVRTPGQQRVTVEHHKAVIRRLITEVFNGGQLQALDEIYTPALAGRARAWIGPFRTRSLTSRWRLLSW